MLGELVPCGGGDPIPLEKPKLLVGRKDFCDVVLRFANISSRHCELAFEDGYWSIRDLGSTNGIRVGGVRCESKVLMPADEVCIGRYRYTIYYTLKVNRLPVPARSPGVVLKRGLLEKAGVEVVGNELVSRRPREDSGKSSSVNWLGELTPCGGGEPILMLQEKVMVGRHPQCDIVLRFNAVSGKHCELTLTDGFWMARDMGSKNGTRVNGVRCESKWVLPGDSLSFASHRYELRYTPPPNKTPPQEPAVSLGESLLAKAGLLRRDKKK